MLTPPCFTADGVGASVQLVARGRNNPAIVQQRREGARAARALAAAAEAAAEAAGGGGGGGAGPGQAPLAAAAEAAAAGGGGGGGAGPGQAPLLTHRFEVERKKFEARTFQRTARRVSKLAKNQVSKLMALLPAGGPQPVPESLVPWAVEKATQKILRDKAKKTEQAGARRRAKACARVEAAAEAGPLQVPAGLLVLLEPAAHVVEPAGQAPQAGPARQAAADAARARVNKILKRRAQAKARRRALPQEPVQQPVQVLPQQPVQPAANRWAARVIQLASRAVSATLLPAVVHPPNQPPRQARAMIRRRRRERGRAEAEHTAQAKEQTTAIYLEAKAATAAVTAAQEAVQDAYNAFQAGFQAVIQVQTRMLLEQTNVAFHTQAADLARAIAAIVGQPGSLAYLQLAAGHDQQRLAHIAAANAARAEMLAAADHALALNAAVDNARAHVADRKAEASQAWAAAWVVTFLVGVDPGLLDFFTAAGPGDTRGNRNILAYSAACLYFKAGYSPDRLWSEKILRKHRGLQLFQSRMPIGTTANLAALQARSVYVNRHLGALLEMYHREGFRIARWHKWIRRTTVLHGIAKHLTSGAPAGHRVVIGWGGASVGIGSKISHRGAGPVKEFRELLEGYADSVEIIDEFRTSSFCSRCIGEHPEDEALPKLVDHPQAAKGFRVKTCPRCQTVGTGPGRAPCDAPALRGFFCAAGVEPGCQRRAEHGTPDPLQAGGAGQAGDPAAAAPQRVDPFFFLPRAHRHPPFSTLSPLTAGTGYVLSAVAPKTSTRGTRSVVR